jgi:hypothetical protein
LLEWWIVISFIWQYELDIIKTSHCVNVMRWKCFNLVTISSGNCTSCLSVEINPDFWNKPLNLAIEPSAKSILGPVTMQTLELAVYLERQHQAIDLSKKVVTPNTNRSC